MPVQVRYKEIYRALMRDIAEGVFSGGEKLPTEQALAEQKVLLFGSLDRFSREGIRKRLEYLFHLDTCKVKWYSCSFEQK